MTRMHRHISSDRGFAMVLLMIVLVIATAIGVWGLTTSKSSIQKAGSRKFSTELTYQAEQALQKSVRRIQSITASVPVDQVAVANANDSSAGKTGGNYTAKNTQFLVNPAAGGLCADTSCAGASNGPCTNYSYLKNFDIIDQNVICNFLGVVDDKTQVSVVRKNDLVANGETFAIFLVNSVAMDSSGRKQAIQGVVVFPYDSTTFTSTGEAYLASSKKVTD